MPVFGKGSGPRSVRLLSARKKLDTRIVREGKKRSYEVREPYPLQATNLAKVEKELAFSISKWVASRFQKTKKPVTVLDWGCDNGLAISELATKFSGKVIPFGFGEDAHRQWANNRQVHFIQETSDGLFRYLKDNSVDLVYSHWGLGHLETRIRNPEKFAKYLRQLMQKIKPGGLLVDEGISSPQLRLFCKEFLEKDPQIIVHFPREPSIPDLNEALRQGKSISRRIVLSGTIRIFKLAKARKK